MKRITILLNSPAKVKSFISLINQYEGKFELVSGRTVLDAKSILGIYTLNLMEPLFLTIENEDSVLLQELKTFQL